MNTSSKRKYLVIVESPGKIKKIETILNKLFPQNKFIVKASYGHIIDLDKKKISVDIKNNFTPVYKVIDSKKSNIIKSFKDTCKKVDHVLLATDEDREGEMIAWSIAKELRLKDPKRIIFNSITEKDLKYAVENPTKINYNIVDAQKVRRILDRIVGFEISPILWKNIGNSSSAGRVQSVVVRLIVDKEEEINNFFKNKLTSIYKITGELSFDDEILKCNLVDDKNKSPNIDNKKEAMKLMKKIVKSKFKVVGISKKETLRRSPPPFTTSTLQQEASRRLGYSLKRTMSVAQKLYEKGYITYMRTDSINLSNEAINKISKYIMSNYGKEYLKVTKYKSKGSNTQNAHEAIRPTDIIRTNLKDKVNCTNDESKLYNLIWKRTVASQMAPAKVNVINLDIDISKTDKVKFISELEELIFYGYLKLYKDNTNNTDKQTIKIPKKNTLLNPTSITANESYKKPPVRFNEASLVNKLDPKNLNIGRPSTYASIMEKIQSKKYITTKNIDGISRDIVNLIWKNGDKDISENSEKMVVGKESNKLVPTNMGVLINTFLIDNFTDIMQYEFTANMEDNLDKIASGKVKWLNILDDFYKKFHKLVTKLKDNNTNILDKNCKELGVDPVTGHKLVTTFGLHGDYVKLVNKDDKTVETAPIRTPLTKDTITLQDAIKLFEYPKIIGKIGRKIVKFYKNGKYGSYVKFGKDSFAIKLTDNLTEKDITIDYINKLIKDKDDKKLWYKKEGDNSYTILNGPYGKYVSIKNIKKKKPFNVGLKNDIDLDKLSLDELLKMIETKKKNRYKKKFIK
jgi:DNA topoisomerase I